MFRMCPYLFSIIDWKTFINSWRRKITGPNPVNSEKKTLNLPLRRVLFWPVLEHLKPNGYNLLTCLIKQNHKTKNKWQNSKTAKQHTYRDQEIEHWSVCFFLPLPCGVPSVGHTMLPVRSQPSRPPWQTRQGA